MYLNIQYMAKSMWTPLQQQTVSFLFGFNWNHDDLLLRSCFESKPWFWAVGSGNLVEQRFFCIISSYFCFNLNEIYWNHICVSFMISCWWDQPVFTSTSTSVPITPPSLSCIVHWATVKVFQYKTQIWHQTSQSLTARPLCVCVCVNLGGAFGHNNLRVPGGRVVRRRKRRE